jgi:hypothetical protein
MKRWKIKKRQVVGQFEGCTLCQDMTSRSRTVNFVQVVEDNLEI